MALTVRSTLRVVRVNNIADLAGLTEDRNQWREQAYSYRRQLTVSEARCHTLTRRVEALEAQLHWSWWRRIICR